MLWALLRSNGFALFETEYAPKLKYQDLAEIVRSDY